MAMDTDQKRYSAMNTFSPWRGPAALPSGTISVGIRQAIAFLYSGIAAVSVVIAYVADLNTRLHVYLCAFYARPETADLNAMTRLYLDEETTGEYTARMQQLITDATEAMQ